MVFDICILTSLVKITDDRGLGRQSIPQNTHYPRDMLLS